MDKKAERTRRVNKAGTSGSGTNKNGTTKSGESVRKMKKTMSKQSGFTRAQILSAFVIMSTTFIISTLALGRLPWQHRSHSISNLDRIALSVGFQKPVYAIMFDAGSTGSRILVFSFHRVKADGSLKLDKEYFEEIKPGLSYYATHPSQAAESLRPLLEKAKLEIPQNHWNTTPLVLKATAGLRLLPGHQAESILEEVRKLFQEYPFHVTHDSVSIMEGRDEGLFSWFTVNFLLDTLADIKDTAATLDLGGGSTQVTFAIEEDSLHAAPPEHIHTVTLFNKAVKLYIHSYLGLGLMAARLDILQTGNSSNTPGNKVYYSPCVHTIVNKEWEYARQVYEIRGKEIPEVKLPEGSKKPKDFVPRFDECFKVTTKVVNSKMFSPKELQLQEVYAISYYFDRASENGLIDPFEGGQVKVDKYIEAAKAACEAPNTDQPFSCLDLTFISSLLSQGLGLAHQKDITLRKRITNHEISWALGAAFHVLAN